MLEFDEYRRIHPGLGGGGGGSQKKVTWLLVINLIGVKKRFWLFLRCPA